MSKNGNIEVLYLEIKGGTINHNLLHLEYEAKNQMWGHKRIFIELDEPVNGYLIWRFSKMQVNAIGNILIQLKGGT